VVNASHAKLDSELETGRLSFDEVLDALPLDDYGLYFVAFCVPRRDWRGPTRGLFMPTVLFEQSRLTECELWTLFGAT
jgi:hypothetical protein